MKQDFNDHRAYTAEEIADWIARYRASGLGLRTSAGKRVLDIGLMVESLGMIMSGHSVRFSVADIGDDKRQSPRVSRLFLPRPLPLGPREK